MGSLAATVSDRKDFADRHDIAGLQIAGEFLGRLSNTEGEIIVTGPFGEAIARLRYQDEWYPSTDGKGRSLQATSPRREQTIKDHWQPSAGDGGTPGH